MGCSFLGGVRCDVEAFDEAVIRAVSSIGAEYFQRDWRGESEHLLLRVLGERPWVLGPMAKRAGRSLALALARDFDQSVLWYWFTSDGFGKESLVEGERIEPDGRTTPLEVELPEEILDGYSYGASGNVSQRGDSTRWMLLARALAVGSAYALQEPSNWGDASGEKVLGACQLPQRLPPWPRAPKAAPPPAVPAVEESPRVVRRKRAATASE